MKLTACSVYRRRQLRLIGIQLDDFVAFDEWQVGIEVLLLRVARPHVVRIGETEVFVEAVMRGQERLLMSKMPLAIDRCGITALLQHFGDRHLVRVDAVLRRVVQRALNSHAVRVRAGQQGGTRSRAHCLRHVEVGQSDAFGGHPIEVGRVRAGRARDRAERADVGVAQVVGVHDDEVGQPLGWRSSARQQTQQCECDQAAVDVHRVTTVVPPFEDPDPHRSLLLVDPHAVYQMPVREPTRQTALWPKTTRISRSGLTRIGRDPTAVIRP